MGKKKLRKIIVDGAPYLWAVSSGHIQQPEPPVPGPRLSYLYSDQFVAFAEGYRRSRVRIRFITWGSFYGGSGLRHGTPQLLGDDSVSLEVNLHTPRWAAILIRLALKQGWRPQSTALTLENGTALLVEHAAALIE